MIKNSLRNFYEKYLALGYLAEGKSESVIRSVRMTSMVQFVLTSLINLLLIPVLLSEPPETHAVSMSLLAILVSVFGIARYLLYKKYFILAAFITLLNLNFHLAGLCYAQADDPAYMGFLIALNLPFLMIPASYPKTRWTLIFIPAILFILDRYFYQVMGVEGLFGPPKLIVSADYLIPPIIMLLIFMIILQNHFVKAVDNAEAKLSEEYEKSEKLILNILPLEVSNELKKNGISKPKHFENATVCFTDFQGFTGIAESLTPSELVEELDRCFSYFDRLMEKYNLEKLKTIGDSYMFAGGIPIETSTHAITCVLASLEIQDFMNKMKEDKSKAGQPYWELRLGIHSGSLVAGVIGEKKFAYDVWSDTVNTASRCESSGVAGKINISKQTYELVKEFFQCEHRGLIPAKNKGEIDMYFVNALLPDFRNENHLFEPNEEFKKKYFALENTKLDYK